MSMEITSPLRGMANHHVVVAQHNGADLRWIMHHVPKKSCAMFRASSTPVIYKEWSSCSDTPSRISPPSVLAKELYVSHKLGQAALGTFRFQTVAFTHPRNLPGPPGIIVLRYRPLAITALPTTRFTLALPPLCRRIMILPPLCARFATALWNLLLAER